MGVPIMRTGFVAAGTAVAVGCDELGVLQSVCRSHGLNLRCYCLIALMSLTAEMDLVPLLLLQSHHNEFPLKVPGWSDALAKEIAKAVMALKALMQWSQSHRGIRLKKDSGCPDASAM